MRPWAIKSFSFAPNFGRRGQRRTRRGLTLIEASLATAIVGIGCLASLNLLAAGTVSNMEAAEQTTGVNLARNIREMTVNQTYDQVRALDGADYTPPHDVRGLTMANMSNWEQLVSVKAITLTNLTQQIVDPNPAAIRV